MDHGSAPTRCLGEMRVEIGIGLAEPPSADPLIPVERAELTASVVETALNHGQLDTAAVSVNDARADKTTGILHGGTRGRKTNHFMRTSLAGKVNTMGNRRRLSTGTFGKGVPRGSKLFPARVS